MLLLLLLMLFDIYVSHSFLLPWRVASFTEVFADTERRCLHAPPRISLLHSLPSVHLGLSINHSWHAELSCLTPAGELINLFISDPFLTLCTLPAAPTHGRRRGCPGFLAVGRFGANCQTISWQWTAPWWWGLQVWGPAFCISTKIKERSGLEYQWFWAGNYEPYQEIEG